MFTQRDSIIIFDKINNTSKFADSQKEVDSCEANKDRYVVYKVGDTVTFQDFAHISNKRLTGVIKRLGWSLGPVSLYISCAIKVENAKFGSALESNYTIIPSALTKVI